MASTTAMFTGLSGLTANARDLDVIGNNIANVNTTAYKSDRMLFATQFSRNLSLGSAPSNDDGGSNPTQIGLGVGIAGTQRDFTAGNVSATGIPSDLAIQGSGFFVVSSGGQRYYTRDGAFQLNGNNQLTTVTGENVMGYGVDNNFNLVAGAPTPINIPLGQATIAEATTEADVSGQLNSDGPRPTSLATFTLPALNDTGGTPAPVTAATLLTAVDDPNTAGTQPLFAVGQSIQISGAKKGNETLPTATLAITATTTVGDLMNFFNTAFETDTTAASPATVTGPGATTAGVTIDSAGQITIAGNIGADDDITFNAANLSLLNSSGNLVSNPLAPTKIASSTGESVNTTLTIYDSLGAAINVNVTMTLETANTGTGTTWRYFVDSPDNGIADKRLGTGTISFDANGHPLSSTPIQIAVDRTGTGAANPLTFDLNYATGQKSLSALAGASTGLTSSMQMDDQNGAPVGTLSSYSIGSDGTISGQFTNGISRTIGQVVVATFANPQGLVDAGNNLFKVGTNSGSETLVTAGQHGTGKIAGGSLELSNVDLSKEFINLILASTGYSASSRVITTTDQLMQQLLVLGR